MRELMPDVASGMTVASAELNSHLKDCTPCAGTLAAMQQTMALLDEWKAPEPTPYFDTRLQALLREEKAKKQSTGLFAWFRRPAFGIGAVAVLAFGVAFVNGDKFPSLVTSLPSRR